ncbi:TetR/AcrR family transcriptional regulator [Conexibacter arvalis]|uniref:AcrR family transcriptional regulator n=1 Tax=Conexibacter arvalis TaxID=912552 RepID=A0A840IM07_9ACTN|nr:AcrR family transcriptional regulator [Conexibacter arvalis]
MSTRQPPRWSRLDPDVRRSEILLAAKEIFGTRPYGSVSITAIAEAAGVSRALVTHYFGGKRELMLATLREYGAMEGLVPRTDLGLPVEETVARNVDAWLDFMAAHRELVFAMTSVSALDRDPEVAQVIDDLRDATVDRMLVNHFGTSDVPAPIRVVLRGYTGLAQVGVADWLVTERATREQIRVLLTKGLLTLLREVLPKVVEVSGPLEAGASGGEHAPDGVGAPAAG